MFRDIRLQHFRSYSDISFDLAPSVNIIVGPNASGKTNLLEAVLVLARGASYRAKDMELIQFGRSWTRLDTTTDAGARSVKIETEPRLSKSYVFDNKPFQRLTLPHTVPVVLFEPNHLLLLSGAPEQRRNYLDDLLEQFHANHALSRRNYRRLLAQRNALLKRVRKPNNEELFPWNLRLSELGALLSRRRAELCESLNVKIGTIYGQLSGSKTVVNLKYQTQFPPETYETQLLHKLESSLSVDLLRGFTAAGPHREDMLPLFDSRPAEEVASRGETRTFVLALKILELELLQRVRDARPLLLLDDVFSELDAARRRALTERLVDYQTFITTTDADTITPHFLRACQVITLAA